MRLLYIANARIPTPRAYGLQIMKTCEALQAAGAAVELVLPSRSVRMIDDPFAYYGVRARFPLRTLRVPDLVSSGPLGFFISTLWFAERVRFLPSFFDADVMYSRDALVLLQYLLLGRTLIFEAHASPSFVSTLVARCARRVVVISHGLRDAYVSAGIMPGKIIVAPDAVDERLFDLVQDRGAARSSLGLPVDERIALYAGHLYSRKGADTLAAAAELLPGTRFVFVGGTSADVAAFQHRWRKFSNITIVGSVAHEQIPLYLRAADILVVPNSGRDEDAARFTSPMKLFEYIASGTPVLASDVPALREILSEENATLVSPDDPAAFARGITEILSYPEDAHARAARAQELARHYSWKNRAELILQSLRVDGYTPQARPHQARG
ncbi:glycosyltransferase [Candidatus Kaiserbacteria bacterium]|nr:glycosyltransferase [Candidatus Kaiserbacteria bacterium]